jgi:hypothetical protein
VLAGAPGLSAQGLQLPPQQKRSKKGPMDSFMPATPLKEKVGPRRAPETSAAGDPGRERCCC